MDISIALLVYQRVYYPFIDVQSIKHIWGYLLYMMVG